MRFPVPRPVLDTLQRLRQHGFEAYLVGGAVRDDLLGIPPRDYDICTSALPGEVRRCFPGSVTLEKGLRHGTVTVRMDGMLLDVTTFRIDGGYSDGRRPDSVAFTRSLEEDLRRRDFTVNALAWSPDTGVVDRVGGLLDLKLRRIAAVGDPALRFAEDALRLLRALRFAAQTGFTVEEGALNAMASLAGNLSKVSRERVAGELNQLLCGGHAAAALDLCPPVVFEALPELRPMPRCPLRLSLREGAEAPGLWAASLRALAALPPEPALRWAGLLKHAGLPAALCLSPGGQPFRQGARTSSLRICRALMARLRQPRALGEAVCALVDLSAQGIRTDSLRLYLSLLGYETVSGLLCLERAWALAVWGPDSLPAAAFARLLERLDRLREGGGELPLGALAVNGHDLMALGYAPGPGLGAALAALHRLVLTGGAQNRRDLLLKLARERLTPEPPPGAPRLP